MISRVHIVPVDGGEQAGSGSGESILDLDDVSALAPGARIQVYKAPLDFNPWAGLVDNFNAIVQDDTAKIATSSWFSGLCEADVQSTVPGLDRLENTIFEQAATQGQTILESAGDSGSDTCPTLPPRGRRSRCCLRARKRPSRTCCRSVARRSPRRESADGAGLERRDLVRRRDRGDLVDLARAVVAG